jgi:hypothetical protein
MSVLAARALGKLYPDATSRLKLAMPKDSRAAALNRSRTTAEFNEQASTFAALLRQGGDANNANGAAYLLDHWEQSSFDLWGWRTSYLAMEKALQVPHMEKTQHWIESHLDTKSIARLYNMAGGHMDIMMSSINCGPQMSSFAQVPVKTQTIFLFPTKLLARPVLLFRAGDQMSVGITGPDAGNFAMAMARQYRELRWLVERRHESDQRVATPCPFYFEHVDELKQKHLNHLHELGVLDLLRNTNGGTSVRTWRVNGKILKARIGKHHWRPELDARVDIAAIMSKGDPDSMWLFFMARSMCGMRAFVCFDLFAHNRRAEDARSVVEGSHNPDGPLRIEVSQAWSKYIKWIVLSGGDELRYFLDGVHALVPQSRRCSQYARAQSDKQACIHESGESYRDIHVNHCRFTWPFRKRFLTA